MRAKNEDKLLFEWKNKETVPTSDYSRLSMNEFVERTLQCQFRPEMLKNKPLSDMKNYKLEGQTPLFIAACAYLYGPDGEKNASESYRRAFVWLLAAGADVSIKCQHKGEMITVVEFLKSLLPATEKHFESTDNFSKKRDELLLFSLSLVTMRILA